MNSHLAIAVSRLSRLTFMNSHLESQRDRAVRIHALALEFGKNSLRYEL